MDLTDEQKQQVARWIADGLKLADVQRRLEEDFGVRLTYMETRFLIDDLQLMPKDEPRAPEPILSGASGAAGGFHEEAAAPAGGGRGKVSVKVAELMRPGAIVSGTVTFSDGNKATWYLDQFGRLAMDPDKMGYRPSQTDMAQFQTQLERELVKLGM